MADKNKDSTHLHDKVRVRDWVVVRSAGVVYEGRSTLRRKRRQWGRGSLLEQESQALFEMACLKVLFPDLADREAAREATARYPRGHNGAFNGARVEYLRRAWRQRKGPLTIAAENSLRLLARRRWPSLPSTPLPLEAVLDMLRREWKAAVEAPRFLPQTE